MRTELFTADFKDGVYVFTPDIYDGTIPNEYRSNGFTYTPNEIRYDHARYFLYCNHELNDAEKRKLEIDWANSPYSPK